MAIEREHPQLAALERLGDYGEVDQGFKILDAATQEYIAGRIAEGKSRREAPACSCATSPATSTGYSSNMSRSWLDKS